MYEIFGVGLEEFMGYAPQILLGVVTLNIVLSVVTIIMPRHRRQIRIKIRPDLRS